MEATATAPRLECPKCDTTFSAKSSKNRHIQKFHAEYYAENIAPNHQTVLSCYKEARRRITVAASQKKYYYQTVKKKKKDEKHFLKYSKRAMTALMTLKATSYFDELMRQYFLIPSLLIPDNTSDQGKAALIRKYEQELDDRQVQINFLKTKVEIELPKVFASIKDNDLKVKIRTIAQENEE